MNIGSLFVITLSFHFTFMVQTSQDHFYNMKIPNASYAKKTENSKFPASQVKNHFKIKYKEEKLFSIIQPTLSSVQDESASSQLKSSKFNSNEVYLEETIYRLSADAHSTFKRENFDAKFSISNVSNISNTQYKYFVEDFSMPYLHSKNGSLITPYNKDDSSYNKHDVTPLLLPQNFSDWSFGLQFKNNSRASRRIRQEQVKVKRKRNNISLWIDERQVRLFSGYPMEIYVIVEGRVMPYILDSDFESQLPIIPSEVKTVNFTWKSGGKKYFYDFDILKSFNADLLHPPFVSIRRRGRVPKKSKSFSVHIPCVGNVSGVATFAIGLLIHNTKGDPLPDTPIHLRLRKKCELIGDPDSVCDEKCANGGICNAKKKCQCHEGYMGKLCQTALCYPQCHNGGTCSSPGRCSCLEGYHGRYCEGGICSQKCLNGGKCMQKDTCACQNGYYGNRCEFSKCIIPCVNNGKCQGVNKCKCKAGYSGNHCEIITLRGLSLLFRRCRGKCRHGECVEHGKCKCEEGFVGLWCKKRISHKKNKNNRKMKLWV